MTNFFAPLQEAPNIPIANTQTASNDAGVQDLFAPARAPQQTSPSVADRVKQAAQNVGDIPDIAAQAAQAARVSERMVADQRRAEEAQRRLQARAAMEAQKELERRLKDPAAIAADAQAAVKQYILDTPEYKKASPAEREDLWNTWLSSTGASLVQNMPEEARAEYRMALTAAGASDVKRGLAGESAGAMRSVLDFFQGTAASVAKGADSLRSALPVFESALDDSALAKIRSGTLEGLGRIELDKANRILKENNLPTPDTSPMPMDMSEESTRIRTERMKPYMLSQPQIDALTRGYQVEQQKHGAKNKEIREHAATLYDSVAPDRYATGGDLRRSAQYVQDKYGDGVYGTWRGFKYAPGMATSDQGASVATGAAALGTLAVTKSPAAALLVSRLGNTALTVSDAQGSAYDNVMGADIQDLKNTPLWADAYAASGSDAGAREILAARAAATVTPAAMAIGWVGGGFGAEHAVTSAAGRLLAEKAAASGATASGIRSWLNTVASKVVAPAVGEGVEEGVTQALGNAASNTVGANVNPMAGVVQAATQGAIFGGLTGASSTAAGYGVDALRGRLNAEPKNPVAADESLRVASAEGLPAADFQERVAGVKDLFMKAPPEMRTEAYSAFVASPVYNSATAAQRGTFDQMAAQAGVEMAQATQKPKAATTVDQDVLSNVDRTIANGVLDSTLPIVLETLAAGRTTGAVTDAGYAAAMYRMEKDGATGLPAYDKPLAAAASMVAANSVLHAAETPYAQNAAYASMRGSFDNLTPEQLGSLDDFADKAYGLTYDADTNTAGSGSTAQQPSDTPLGGQEPIAAAIEAIGGPPTETTTDGNRGTIQDDARAVPSSAGGVGAAGPRSLIRRSDGGGLNQAPAIPTAAGDSGAGSVSPPGAERPSDVGSASSTADSTGGITQDTADGSVEAPFDTTPGEAGPIVRDAWTALSEEEQNAVRAEYAAQKATYAGTDYELPNITPWTTDNVVTELERPTRNTAAVPLWKRAVMKLAAAVRKAQNAIGAVLLSVALATGTVSTDANANSVVMDATPTVSTISADANVVNAFVQQNNDSPGKSYIIADKKAGTLYIMNADGTLQTTMPALFGKTRGDAPVPSQTPAGKFKLELKGVTGDTNNMYGGNIQQFAGTDSNEVYAIHRVINTKPEQKRLGRLASATAADNRISNGCINVPADAYDKYLNTNVGSNVYIIPEETSVERMFPGRTAPTQPAPVAGTATPTESNAPTTTTTTPSVSEFSQPATQRTTIPTVDLPAVRPSTDAPSRGRSVITEADMVNDIAERLALLEDTAPIDPLAGAAVLLGAGTLRRRKGKNAIANGADPVLDKTLPADGVDADTTAVDTASANIAAKKAEALASWGALLRDVAPEPVPALNTEVQKLLDALNSSFGASPVVQAALGASTNALNRTIAYADDTIMQRALNAADRQLAGSLVALSLHLSKNGAPRSGGFVDSFPLVGAIRTRSGKQQNMRHVGQRDIFDPISDVIGGIAATMDIEHEVALRDMGNYATLRHLTEEAYDYHLQKYDERIAEETRTIESIEAYPDWQGDRDAAKKHAASTGMREDLTTARAKARTAINTPGEVKTGIPGGVSRPDAVAEMAALEAKYNKEDLLSVSDDIAGAYQKWVQLAVASGAYTQAEYEALRSTGFTQYVPLYTADNIKSYAEDPNGEEDALFATYAPEDHITPTSGVQSDFTRHTRGGSTTRAADAVSNLQVFGEVMARKIANADVVAETQSLYDAGTPGLVRVSLKDRAVFQKYKETPYVLGKAQDSNGNPAWFRYYWENKPINDELTIIRDPEYSSRTVHAMATITRAVGRTVTYRTFMFNIYNAVKDYMTRFTDLSNRNLMDAQGNQIGFAQFSKVFFKESFGMQSGAQKAIYTYLRTGKTDNSKYGKLIQEMLDTGALHTQFESTEMQVDGKQGLSGDSAGRRLRRTKEAILAAPIVGRTLRGVKAVDQFYLDTMVQLPQVMNSMLSYSVMKELGVNKKEAALRNVALFDATANTAMTRKLSPFYLFARSRGQGAGNFLQTLRFSNSGAGRAMAVTKVLGSRVALYTGVLALASMAMGKGDDGEDLIDTMSYTALAGGVPVRMGDDGSTINIVPIGFGVDSFAWKAAIITRRMLSGRMSVGEGLSVLTGAFVSEAAPVDPASREVFAANPAAWAWASAAPTILKPISEVAQNTNAFGVPIVRGNQAADARASESGSFLTPDIYKDLARLIYPLIDARPENLQHLVNSYAYGPWAAVKALTADKEAKTGGVRTSEAEELGWIGGVTGFGRTYNSGASNAQQLYFHNINKRNDILKSYNVDTSDPANRGHAGRKERMIRSQLQAAGATPAEIAFVDKTMAAEKRKRAADMDAKGIATAAWERGEYATDSMPAVRSAYEEADAVIEDYLKGVPPL